MKLGKLLAAGKSIMSGRTDISYRSSKQIYLPKFVSAKNPFKSECTESAQATEASAPSPVETSKPTVVSMPRPAPRPTRAAPAESPATPPVNQFVMKTQKIPAVPTVPTLVTSSTKAKKSNWTVKFDPSLIFRRALAQGAVKPSTPAAKSAAATQAELSLDSVKVVHNDLSDVDVEIVPIKSRAAPTKPEAPKKSWEFLGERLFGVETT